MSKLKVLLASVFLAIFLTPTNVISKPKKIIKTLVVKQKTRFKKRVIFIYDCSGSMNRGILSRAFSAFSLIAKQPVDEMQIALIAFDDRPERWSGIPEKNKMKLIPKGWAAMPSMRAFIESKKWINNLKMGGSTYIVPALKLAFAEKRNKISIVIISDGGFNDDIPFAFLNGEFAKLSKPQPMIVVNQIRIQYFKKIIEILQKRREKLKLDRIQTNCFGVGNIIKNSEEDKMMAALATVGEGFYIRETVR